MEELTMEMMWKAAEGCDKRFDGLFLYAIQTTGIYCRPSCRSRTPKRENVSFYFHLKEAEAAGFRPCKRCRPDLGGDEYDPDWQTEWTVLRFMEENYQRSIQLADIAEAAGISAYHLNRLLRKRTGVTPRMLIEKIRIQKAEMLLVETDLNCADIAFQTGFQSVSSFYTAFKCTNGMPPGLYRQMRRKTVNV